MRFPRSVLFMSLLIVGSGALIGCEKSPDSNAAVQAPAPQVGVVTIKSTPTLIATELPGRTTAFQTAEIRPQVSGIVRKREFTEGAQVKQGQPLYIIDSAPYEASLASAKAALASAEASLYTNRAKAKRVEELVKNKLVSQQDYDDTQAAFKQAEANVLNARAQVKSAEINVGYTRVVAPISGQISKSSVTAGALVTANQTTSLATISQLDPIYVDITQSSSELLRLKQALSDGQLSRDDNTAKVALLLENGEMYSEEGKLQFSEVTVDPSTGSITLRAVFPNPNGILLPGMYVRAKVSEGVLESAILAPQRGVARNSRGEPTALVVNADNVVELRALKTDRTVGDQWLIESGLVDGDRVIVEGLQRVKPGVPVDAQPFETQAPSNSQQ
jgi:membrane fusion protein (multidrug efflux system)